ncbi:hypothetical protein P8452_45054 [Trifolium repens]|nr:hypothetical protein P8452_45054 [Trifolium repens]
MDAKDNLAIYYVVIPCAVLSLLIHPINRILWAFCVYVEAVSVLPQLQVMLLSNQSQHTMFLPLELQDLLSCMPCLSNFLQIQSCEVVNPKNSNFQEHKLAVSAMSPTWSMALFVSWKEKTPVKTY